MTEEEQVKLVNKIAKEIDSLLFTNCNDEISSREMITLYLSSLSKVIATLYIQLVPRSKQKELMEDFAKSLTKSVLILMKVYQERWNQEEENND